MLKNNFVVSGKRLKTESESRFCAIDNVLERAQCLLMFDLSIKVLIQRSFWRTPRRNRFLFLVEPRSVAPHQYWPIWKLLFSKVASNSSESSNWRAGYVSEKEIAALGMSWPTSSRKKSPAAIVSNKFSMHRDSKYWVRRRVFASISSSSGRLFLAGRGWTDSFRVGQVIKHFVFILTSFNFPRFRGDILQAAKFLRSNPGILYVGEKDSAISFLSEYEIAVVVENESTGYVSEKLSDAILSGCKVAYMGGKLNKEFVEGYPVVVFTHPNHAADAVQILSEMEMPDNRNQRVVSAAKSQLEDLAIQTMALRTAKLIETHKS